MQSNEKEDGLIYCKIDPNKPGGIVENYENDAGKDLLTNISFVIEPHSFTKPPIPTNTKVILPKGTCGVIMSKSSLASKGIGVLGGLIDEGYEGEIKVILSNSSEKKIYFNEGDRIAQIVCDKIISIKGKEVTISEYEKLLSTSERKDKGFGSLK
jgi:dUTP pyrophosphatase